MTRHKTLINVLSLPQNSFVIGAERPQDRVPLVDVLGGTGVVFANNFRTPTPHFMHQDLLSSCFIVDSEETEAQSYAAACYKIGAYHDINICITSFRALPAVATEFQPAPTRARTASVCSLDLPLVGNNVVNQKLPTNPQNKQWCQSPSTQAVIKLRPRIRSVVTNHSRAVDFEVDTCIKDARLH